MNCREYGPDRQDAVVLLHGGGLSWWNYREEARLLQNDFRVILPILDGHAGSDRPFTDIGSSAEEIIAWIDEHLGGRAALIGGLSLGGQILLEMLSRRRDICRYAIVESAAVIPSPLTHALIGPVFGSSYTLIRNRSFARLQFRSLHMKPELFEDYYCDTCGIRKSDMTAFLKANTAYSLPPSVRDTEAKVWVFAGGKENREIRRSVQVIAGALPGCAVRVMPGWRHGDFSINHAETYARTVRELLGAAQEP